MRFDWYQASVLQPYQAIMETISKTDFYGDWVDAKPLKNYGAAASFVVGTETRFKIHYGGQNEEHGANVVASGGYAQVLADVLRENFPAHRVSRLDSCEDYYHRDAYDYLRKMALKVAKANKVQCREIVKPLADSDDGRTLYVGSQTSPVSMRIYEKGKQLQSDSEWVRAELQVRPQKNFKALIASVGPADVWGMSKWSHEMGVKLGNKNLQRVEAEVYQPSDHDRAYRFMLRQYHRVLQSMLESHGSPEAVGAQIFYDLSNIEELAKKPVIKRVP